jgi:tight adherence protein C
VSVAILLGALTGIGCVGVVHGVRAVPPSLDSIAATVNRPLPTRAPVTGASGMVQRSSRVLVEWTETSSLSTRPWWTAMKPSLAITGVSLESLASRVLVSAGVGLLGPPLLWLAAQCAGVALSPEVPILLAVVAVPTGICLPVASVVGKARDRRRHFRVVIGSFVDMVVLSLAGGIGIDGSLYAASLVSTDWAARSMARALARARDSGQSPWSALGRLGEEIGVSELIELSTTVELAGTEGARIRQSLSARAVSLRRHEQADAESAANAMTERLFLPGALLLMGFLLFIGYPAFTRIVGGI